MYPKHSHIEHYRDEDEAKCTSSKMLCPEALHKYQLRLFKCLKCPRGHTGVVVFVSPSKTQSWTSVRLPIQAIVNNPTHFTLTVAPRQRPVAASQNHQSGLKAYAGPSSCWFVKQVQARAVAAVKITKGESSRIRRDWVSRPFSGVGISM